MKINKTPATRFKRIGIRQASDAGFPSLVRTAQEDGLVVLQKREKDVAIVISYDERGFMSFADFMDIQGEFLKVLQNFNFEFDIYSFLDAFTKAVQVAKGEKKYLTVYDDKELTENSEPKTILIDWDRPEEISSEDSAMLGSNMSADETGADKQDEHKVRSARSVTKKKKSPAKSEKSPPTGGTSAKGRVKR